jgi:hypothetical protein
MMEVLTNLFVTDVEIVFEVVEPSAEASKNGGDRPHASPPF